MYRPILGSFEQNVWSDAFNVDVLIVSPFSFEIGCVVRWRRRRSDIVFVWCNEPVIDGSLYQECWSHDQTKENLMLSSAWTVFVNCRFYLMRLKNRTWQFEAMTHHAHTTQCLGALHGLPWYIGVGQSTIIGTTERVDPDKRPQVLKAPGYEYMPPAVEDIKIFRIDGSCFVKLHQGTWHCAPLFKEPYMEFYNLELSNTNVSLYCHLLHLVFMILLACLIVRGSLLNPRRSHHPDVLVSEFHQYVVLLLTCVSCLAIIHSCGMLDSWNQKVHQCEPMLVWTVTICKWADAWMYLYVSERIWTNWH